MCRKKFSRAGKKLSRHLSDLDKETFRLDSKKTALEEQTEKLMNYMWEEYELTYSHALEMRKEELLDPVLLKKEIQRLKTEIKALGTVNVNAIEDYKNVLERYEFLKGQHDDLMEAEKTLVQIIEELDIAMRKQFEEQFAKIAKEFDSVFKQLFGGGKGTLELLEDERHSRSGYSHYCTAAREKTAKYDAAFWWRKGADGHCTFVCYPKFKAIPILSS